MRSVWLATAAASLALAACSPAPEAPAPQAVPVETITIAATQVPNLIELPGRVEALRAAEVRARVTGILQRQLYTEGSDVRQGQPLFEIDPAELRASYAQIEASLQRAQATAANARGVVDRYRSLVDENAISRQEYDAAVAASREADANVAQIRAQLRASGLQLGYTTVRAPISGRAGRREVTEGALVSQAEGTLLTTIEQIGTVLVSFSSSAREVLDVRRGIAEGRIDMPEGGMPVTLTLPDGSEYPIPGTIDFLDQSVAPGTGTVQLRARFANPEGVLLPGEFVRVQLQAGTIRDGITVPQRAVMMGDGRGTVYVIDENGQAAARPVKLGAMIDGRFVVEDGLAPGDVVIVSNLQTIRPGAPVQAKGGAAPAAAPPAAAAPATQAAD